MFVVDEETAAAIRRPWEEGGEPAGVVELRRASSRRQRRGAGGWGRIGRIRRGYAVTHPDADPSCPMSCVRPSQVFVGNGKYLRRPGAPRKPVSTVPLRVSTSSTRRNFADIVRA